MSIELVMPSNHLTLCHPLPLLPSIFPSIRVFSDESLICIRWPTYRNFSFSISPSNEYSGLMKFQYFVQLMRRVDSLEKTLMLEGIGARRRGRPRMRWLDGRESEWTPGVGDGQGGLACCDSWGRKESNTTEQLNWTESFLKILFYNFYTVNWSSGVHHWVTCVQQFQFCWLCKIFSSFCSLFF